MLSDGFARTYTLNTTTNYRTGDCIDENNTHKRDVALFVDGAVSQAAPPFSRF